MQIQYCRNTYTSRVTGGEPMTGLSAFRSMLRVEVLSHDIICNAPYGPETNQSSSVHVTCN